MERNRQHAAQIKKIAVHAGELVSVTALKCLIKEKDVRNELLQEENESLKKRCEQLFCDMVDAQRETRVANEDMDTVNVEIDRLRNENQKLHSYIENLGQELTFKNNGGTVTEIGKRHQRRKLKELKSNVERALWFANTFGLQLRDIDFVDQKGTSHKMSFAENEKCSYKDLHEDDQQKVKNILFVLDKFCIGEAAYHELTMVCEGADLPKSYLIKQCKEELNKMSHITRTPGSAQGAQLSFAAELESVIQSQVTTITFISRDYCVVGTK